MTEKPTAAEVAKALRCVNGIGSKCRENECRYYAELATAAELERFALENDINPADIPANFAWGCDYDRLSEDAAQILDSFPRWIPVEEKLPDMVETAAGSHYSEAVALLTDGRKVITGILSDQGWICDDEFWDAENEEITHWMSVLPLPELPEGGAR